MAQIPHCRLSIRTTGWQSIVLLPYRMQKPSDPAAVRGDRNIWKWSRALVALLEARNDPERTSIVLILENSVQDQFGAPLQVFLCFTLCGKQNIFLFESFLEDKVGELRFYRLSCPTLVTTVFTIDFTAVLSPKVSKSAPQENVCDVTSSMMGFRFVGRMPSKVSSSVRRALDRGLQ